jgi:hypothetical protein
LANFVVGLGKNESICLHVCRLKVAMTQMMMAQTPNLQLDQVFFFKHKSEMNAYGIGLCKKAAESD